MSTLIPSGGGTPTATDPIPNSEFFPDLDLADFRAKHNLDSTVPDDQAAQHLQLSMYEVNGNLICWMQLQIEDDISDIREASTPFGEDDSIVYDKEQRYLEAVYAGAYARILDTYSRFDATNEGHDRARDVETTADYYRGLKFEAIRAILDETRTDVELI